MKEISLTVPRGYAEMTEQQTAYVAKLLLSGQTIENIRVKCFIRFAGIRPIVGNSEVYWFVKPKLRGFFSMKVEDVMYWSDRMDWLHQSYIGVHPAQKIGRYHPCHFQLRDTSFIQYIDAENYYQAYLHTADKQYLYKLMATLYQPGQKYNNDNTPKIARKIARKAKKHECQLALMWMMGIKELFAQKFSDLFVAAPFSEENPEPPNMYKIIRGQLRMLSGGDITKENAVLASKTWTALDELNEKCREARQQQVS